MNLPNKLTVSRIILSIIIIFIMLFPFYQLGIDFPKYIVKGLQVDIKYLICGFLFIIACITDFLDGYIARKKDLVTDTGKVLDSIADKVLLNSILIIFSYLGYVSPIVPVILVTRDTIVNSIKMEALSRGRIVSSIKSGKIKTFALMIGIILMYFYNLPFELYNLRVDLFFVYFATVMSIISMIEYYNINKKIIFPQKKKEEIM